MFYPIQIPKTNAPTLTPAIFLTSFSSEVRKLLPFAVGSFFSWAGIEGRSDSADCPSSDATSHGIQLA
jgi:hypothetical protein